MRGSLMLTIYAGLAAVPGLAGAACNIDEAGLRERHEALASEKDGSLTDASRQAFHSLRQTAETLNRSGFDAACDEIVDAALGLLEQDAAWAAGPAPAAGPDETVGALNLVTFDATGRPLETAGLVGRAVHSTEGGPLGEVTGVLLDQARDASHLIVSHGGFWERGERLVAIPSTRILLDPSTGSLYSEIPPEKLAEAPEYDRAEPWQPAENDAWYDQRAAEAVAAARDRALESRGAERESADRASADPADPAEEAAESETAEHKPALRRSEDPATRDDGPKRVRIEKDRPETAAGSND